MSCDLGYVDPTECPTCPVRRDEANANALDRIADAVERIADAVEILAFPTPERPA